MSKKLTKFDIQERSDKKHNYEYEIIGDYIGYNTPILTKHIKCGYEWNMNIGNHITQGKGCPKCSNNAKLSELDFIEKSRVEHNGEFELISKFKSTKHIVTLKHICGHVFNVKPYNHLYGKTGCPKCKGGVKLDITDIQIRLNKIYENDYIIIEYNGYNGISKFIHNKCGKELNVIVSNLLQKFTKCTCDGNIRWSRKLFLDKQSEIHGYDYELIGNFINMNNKIKLKHTCGYEWSISPKKHIYGKQGCPVCNMSHGELQTKRAIEKLEINYKQQFIINSCRNKKPLPFDFYLPTYNVLIEYDGIQHFEPIEYFGGEFEFKRRKRNDEIKNKYCSENNIKLIRIPYTCIDIKELLKTELF